MKIKTPNPTIPRTVRWVGLLLVVSGLLVHPEAMAMGHWTQLTRTPPNGGKVELMLLLSDGTVMAQNEGGNGWFKLTPDSHGHYVDGLWANRASMTYARQYYSSAILRDGRVFVAGCEYPGLPAPNSAEAELYNPLTDIWTPAPHAGVDCFGDSIAKILSNGNVLLAPVCYNPFPANVTFIYNPTMNTWSTGPTSAAYQDEASWVKLPDDSILTIDENVTTTERYIPSLNQWIPDRDVPIAIYGGNSEMGAAFLLPNGRAFFLGGSGHTAIYTPSGNTSLGTWAQGADIPNGMVAQDAPAAMMVNGKILCAFTSSTAHKPIFFYEYDPVANAFYPTSSPQSSTIGSSDNNVISDATCMLDLPDGTVLYSHLGSDVYVYQPDPADPPLASGKPTINSIVANADGSYHLIGTKLNGISEGAAFGDDAQMDSNYPLVRLTDGSGNVYYGRTYNWSSTSVQTGNRPVTTEFILPPSLQTPGSYSLVVVANGIASDPVPFSGSVWVAFGVSDPGIGTYDRPFNTLPRGTNAVSVGGTIFIKGPGSTAQGISISKPMTIQAIGGPATIGH